MAEEYNPLDYANLTKNCVVELMSRGPFTLPLAHQFEGSGVYALFYQGSSRIYSRIRSSDAKWPIYVGKAVPPGARKGGGGSGSRALYGRISQHARTLEAVGNLRLRDFACRYLVVTPLWITMAERFLVEHYRPVWNVCMDGFGNHDPGAGRREGEITWWDALPPGRPWATSQKQTRTAKQAEDRLSAFMKTYEMKSLEDAIARKPSDDHLVDEIDSSENE